MYSIKKYIPISFTYIAIVATIFACLVKTQFFDFTRVRNACILVVAVFVILNLKKIKKEYFGIETVFFLIHIGWSIYASYLNVGGVVTTNPFLSSLAYSVLLTECYLFFAIMAGEGLMNKYIDLLFKYLFGIMVVNDLLILARITNSTYYLVGIKFDVTYLHIMVLALFYYKYMMTEDIDRITWVKYIVLIAESVLIAKVVDCATGLVGAVLLVVMLFVHRNKNYIMNKRLLILLVAIACMLFPFWYNLILSNHYVTYFVEGILHKKITLTGRTYIYEIALVLLGDGWLTGYGIGTNYEICMRAGFVNIQNGFLKVFMDTGIIGGLSLLALVFLVFGRTKNSRKETIIFASYIFVFIILSSIEITIGNTFMFWLLFLFVYGRAVRNTNKK